MNKQRASLEPNPMESLKFSDTQLLSTNEERELLEELVRCKAKLGDALRGVRNKRDDEDCDQLQFIARHVHLDPAQEATLGATYRRLQEVRTKLALSNMRLVAHVAKRFRDRGVSYSDLLQEGFQGLLEAIDRFEISHGTKLATYATWWIRQAMQQAVASGAYPVRLSPRHLRQLAQSQEGTSNTSGPLNRGSESSSGGLIDRIYTATRPAISLNQSSDPDSGFDLSQMMSDTSSVTTTEIDACEAIDRLMGVLGQRERDVLSMRFGLGGIERLSLSEAGVRLNVSKERVRQIQDRALEKLRSAARAQSLEAEFLLAE